MGDYAGGTVTAPRLLLLLLLLLLLRGARALAGLQLLCLREGEGEVVGRRGV
jgi:hypothetical protein